MYLATQVKKIMKAKHMFNQREKYQSATCKRQLQKLVLGDRENLKIILMIEAYYVQISLHFTKQTIF